MQEIPDSVFLWNSSITNIEFLNNQLEELISNPNPNKNEVYCSNTNSKKCDFNSIQLMQ